MLSNLYLAMTGAEIAKNPPLDPHFCFMACHFAPYGQGLSNIPESLQPGGILMVNDRTPPAYHDADLIAAQLQEATERLRCSHVILDFQRPGMENTSNITRAILEALPCPVIVSAVYAAGLPCPVLLPPVPLGKALEEFTASWVGRELWAEAALDACTITVTKDGSRRTSCEVPDFPLPHFDSDLLCRYGLELKEEAAVFTLHRSWENLQALMNQGIITAWVGLHQELGKYF